MKYSIIQYVHRVNNSELGKTGTHETYILIKKSFVEILKQMFFLSENEQIDSFHNGKAIDFKSKYGTFKLKLSLQRKNKEWRVTGLGSFYKKCEPAKFGDTVILTMFCYENTCWYSIEYIRNDYVFFQKKNKEFWTIYKRDYSKEDFKNKSLDVFYKGKPSTLYIKDEVEAPIRTDSKEPIDQYSVFIDNKKLDSKQSAIFALDTRCKIFFHFDTDEIFYIRK